MKDLYDLIIIGAGPAGLSAAIYAGRAKLKTLVLDMEQVGGQIKITSEVVNYPGIRKISGEALGQEMQKQAEGFGVEFKTAQVKNVDFTQDLKFVETSEVNYQAVSVIIATGSRPRSLGFQGEQEFKGRGVAYCATCDGEFFTGMDVFVIGAGFAAAEEAIYLTRFAKRVRIIAREPDFTCSKTIGDKVKNNDDIDIYFNTEIVYADGDNVLRKAKFINNQTKETWEYEAEPNSTFGIFVFVGYEPISQLFTNKIRMNEYGYILTNENMKTNVEGVYAAGDIRPKSLRQLVTAVSDGAVAATDAEKYIADKKEKLQLVIEREKSETEATNSFFNDELKEQVTAVLDKFDNPVHIAAILSDDALSKEIQSFLEDISSFSHNLAVQLYAQNENKELEQVIQAEMFPVIALLNKKNEYTGIKFHGVPSGHEFNSFVLSLYNVAGPGQQTSPENMKKIDSIQDKLNIKVGVSLSCTMCPEVVQASQFIAANNENVEAEMIDVSKYHNFKKQYNIMSVPAIILNDKDVLFGKTNLEELLNKITVTA